MAVAVAAAVAVAVVAPGSSSGHLDFIVASPGISDYDGAEGKKARRTGLRHWYVVALSNPKPFESLQEECSEIAKYVRNHVLTDFCIQSPTLEMVGSTKKVGRNADSETTISFATARERLGRCQPMVTDLRTIPRDSAWSAGPPGASERTAVESKTKKRQPAPTAKAIVKAEPKSYPAAPPVYMYRGAGWSPVLLTPPMAVNYQQMPVKQVSMLPGRPLAMPKGNQVSSSGAAGAQEEDYDEVFGCAPVPIPAPATACVTDPGTSQMTGDSLEKEAKREKELPASETMPAPTPTLKKEDQDHELQQMSTTPLILEQAAAYLVDLDARGSKAGKVTATERGAPPLPLCLAVAKCSVSDTPVNRLPPSDPGGSAGDDDEYEGDVEQGQVFVSGIRKMPDGTVVLEPIWFHAQCVVWLLNVRKRVQDDSSFLNAKGQH